MDCEPDSKDRVSKVMKGKMQLTLFVIIRVINKVCPFVVVVIIDTDDFHNLCSLVANTIWLQHHKWLGGLNNGIKLDVRERTR